MARIIKLGAETTTNRLVVLSAFLFVVFYNMSFFRHVVEVYPLNGQNTAFVLSLTVFLGTIIVLLLAPFCTRHTVKPVLISFMLVSSLAAYFMDSYNVFIDDSMITNILETDYGEAADLLSFKLLWYFLLLGLLPAFYIYRVRVVDRGLKKELLSKVVTMLLAALMLAAVVVGFSKFYASFLREHKVVRYYTNPVYYVYSFGKFVASKSGGMATVRAEIGRDATVPGGDDDRELVVLVVGETARSDRFSLNGYPRETNPYTAGEQVISFPEFYSCGTSTAESLPCMFSYLQREEYSIEKSEGMENLLDVLNHAGVSILWRDNNSGSKGVADFVTFEDFRNDKLNPVCDSECRDEGMLVGLQEYIDSVPSGDIFIVLHQMGNHGPAYYKRYPEQFARFQPVCTTNQLEDCSREEINNAYDNAILYTDYFLSKVIELLKKNGKFETAMFYVSDHGESLGENGIYLHGMPYFMAPDPQVHVPAIMWFGDNYHVDRQALLANSKRQYSHDNIFHTVLGLMEIQTSVYRPQLDILRDYQLADEDRAELARH